jgi:hypothetical protein
MRRLRSANRYDEHANFLRSYRAATAKRILIEQRLYSDCKAIGISTQQLRIKCAEIVERLRTDYSVTTRRLRSDCKPITERLYSYSTAISQRFRDDYKAIPK